MKPDNAFSTLKSRYGLTSAELARYLGVPLPTLIKWLQEDREPPAVAVRLLEIMEMIARVAPDIHAMLLKKRKP